MTFSRQAINAKKLGERVLERELRDRFTGIGLKNSPQLIVWVERPEDIAKVPPQINGIPTFPKYTGFIETRPFAKPQHLVYDNNYEYVKPLATSAANKQKRIRPLVGGISIGPPPSGGFVSSGTGGAIVFRATDGRPMILTNFHVAFLDRDNATGRGNAIYQPSLQDGGNSSQDRIGYTYKWVPYKLLDEEDNENHMDACVVMLEDEEEYSPEVIDIGAINPTPADPKVGTVVRKSGRNCYQEGEITATNQTMFVNDKQAGRLKFVNCVVAEPGSLMIPGDSGSIWLDKPGPDSTALPRPLCLGFAGGDTIAVGHPIKSIMNALGFTFVADNVAPQVDITYPRDGQSLYQGRIRFRGTASDDQKVEAVDIRIDLNGNQVGEYVPAQTGNGYRNWFRDITIRTIGNHKIVARATDSAGNHKWKIIFISIRKSPFPSDETPDSDQPGGVPPPPIKSATATGLVIGAVAVASITGGYYAYKKGWFG